jgi:hypothetical protein
MHLGRCAGTGSDVAMQEPSLIEALVWRKSQATPASRVQGPMAELAQGAGSDDLDLARTRDLVRLTSGGSGSNLVDSSWPRPNQEGREGRADFIDLVLAARRRCLALASPSRPRLALFTRPCSSPVQETTSSEGSH